MSSPASALDCAPNLRTPEQFEEFIAGVLDQRGLDTDQIINDWWVFDDPSWLLLGRHGDVMCTQFEDFCAHWLVSVLHRPVARDHCAEQLHALFTNSDLDAAVLLDAMADSADLYSSLAQLSPADPRGRFLLRAMVAVESDVAMPLVLWLPNSDLTMPDQVAVLDVMESWLVRRALCGLPTNGAALLIPELIGVLDAAAADGMLAVPEDGEDEAAHSSRTTDAYTLACRCLLMQQADATSWPTDAMVSASLVSSPIARRLTGSVLAMLLTALEERLRAEQQGLVDGPRTVHDTHQPIPQLSASQQTGPHHRNDDESTRAVASASPDHGPQSERTHTVFAEFTAPTTPVVVPGSLGQRAGEVRGGFDGLESGPSASFRRLSRLWLRAEPVPSEAQADPDEEALEAQQVALEAVAPPTLDQAHHGESHGEHSQSQQGGALDASANVAAGSGVGQTGQSGAASRPRWVYVELPAEVSLMHLMPVSAQGAWAQPSDEDNPRAIRIRDIVVDSLGNLTLIEQAEPADLGQAPWSDDEAHAAGLACGRRTLAETDGMALGQDLPALWTEQAILERGHRLAATVMRIWPNPGGPESGSTRIITLEDSDQMEFQEPFRTEQFLDMPVYGNPAPPPPPMSVRKAPIPRRKPSGRSR